MMLKKIICYLVCFVLVESYIIGNTINHHLNQIQISEEFNKSDDIGKEVGQTKINGEENVADVFNGVYMECFLYLSYSCIQKRTLLYLKKLNDLNEVSVIGDYVKFVKTNTTVNPKESFSLTSKNESSEDLSLMIDNSLDTFFDNHVLKFKALGRDITIPRTVNEFVGRKKRKGGGGGGGGGGHGHDDMKKKMMMMGMMCMKMKLMMMIPAMMGMMGMMSFKGMMFSMMSFMMTKMMLLMKILEKKGSFGGGGGDAGWAAGGGGGGAWMPAGGPDYSGGGGGAGGYDANGQWQARSLFGNINDEENQPSISYVISHSRNHKNNKGELHSVLKDLSDEVIKIDNKNEIDRDEQDKPKSRRKRGIVDIIHSAYLYWMNKLLGPNRFSKYTNTTPYPKYKIINGIKYVYSPIRNVKPKPPKVVQSEISNDIKPNDGFKPIVMMEDYNKGEIVDVAESRMHKKKIQEMKETIDMAVDDNPWQ